MCLTVPALITSIEGTEAVIDERGTEKRADLALIPGARVGDWILHINNLVIRKISAEDAGEIIELLEGSNPPSPALLSEEFSCQRSG